MLGKSLRIYAVVALVICVLGATAYAKDYVVLKPTGTDEPNREYASARILDFTQSQLIFENDSMKNDKPVTETVKAKWSEVISWTVDPDFEKTRDFAVGFKAMRETEYSAAMDAFDRVLSNKEATEVEKHLAYRYIIYCGYVGNERGNAGYKMIAIYAPQFKKDFSNSYFLKEVYDTWGRSLLNQRKVSEAKKIFEELKNYSPALSSMRLAIIVYYEGDFEKAVPMFQKAVSTAGDDKFTKDFSNVLLAHCYQNLQKWANAKEILEKLTSDTDDGSDSPDVLGKAYLYLGIEYGRNNEYYKAFINLMKAYTLYKDNLSSNEAVDALAYALICAQELGKQDEKWTKRAEKLNSSFKEIHENQYDKRKTEFPK